MQCPCHSGKAYKECCGPYHAGTPAPTAAALMRSRYAAYALKLVDYVIATTHPDNPEQPLDRAGLLEFCEHTEFAGLEILDFQEGAALSTVTFRPRLKQGDKELVYIEKSLFEKVDGKWLYKDFVKN